MKITASSDWRDSLPFETPLPAASTVPGEPTICVTCGADSEPRPREELWVVKHRHPNNHAGFVRFYCVDHRPAALAPAATVVAPTTASGRPRRSTPAAPRTPRQATSRPTHPADRVRAMCPNCFLEISATGVCGNCGWSG
jgi:hypothetical protein